MIGTILDFNTFHKLHSETLMYYQIMEHDLKYIYAYMKKGDIDENFDKIENRTLGQMVKMLKDLDQSDGNPLISASDYNFLGQISDNRNHWAHKVFSEFIYIQNWQYSKEYQKQCDKLKKDHDRVERACDILEKIRIDYCSRHKR